MMYNPRKRFGQHFLTTPEIIEKIVATVAPMEGQTIVEIGPGQAAITEPLSYLATKLHAIELDRCLAASLRNKFSGHKNVTIHESDALKFDFGLLGDDLRLVGNLPYNISTPLLFHLLLFRTCIADAHFMLQKEVVDRICAEPGNKNYGRLTIMLGCQVQTIRLFDVPPESFRPRPKVMSTVVKMCMLPEGTFDIWDNDVMESIVKLAFSRRRKTLRNALRGMVTPPKIEAIGIDAGLRPEQVAIADWIALANSLSG